MRLAPEMHSLARVRWDLFSTLTFAGEVPRPGRRAKVLSAWLHDVAGCALVPFKSLLWVSRDEAGEMFGRHHFHVIIGGIPSTMLHTTFRKRLESRWAAGFADVRLWCEGLGTLGYLGVDGANLYESSKFVGVAGLTVSESLLVMVSTGDNVGTQSVKHSRKDRSEVVIPDNAGNDHQRIPRLVPEFPGRVKGLYLAAANASDQGTLLHYVAANVASVKP